MRGSFQATIVDDEGNVIPSASIEVRDEVSGDLVQLYEAFEDGDALGNPFDADANGFALFYADPGRYKITATSDDFERVWRHVQIHNGNSSGTFTGALTGVSGTVSPDISFFITGRICTLCHQDEDSYSGASTSTSMTMTGLPEACLASFNRFVPCRLYNNSASILGYAMVSNSGTITFYANATSSGATGFTASGFKGLSDGWMITYPLD